MKKPVIIFIITFLIETGLTYVIAEKFEIRFIEIMFFSGLAYTLITYWFSSSGGLLTRAIDGVASGQTGLIQKYERFKFTNNPIFVASLSFMFMGLVIFILLIVGIIPPVQN